MFSSVNVVPQGPTVQFDEIAIADFEKFQIAVPTAAQVKKVNNLGGRRALNVAAPVRQYSSSGWLICDRHIAAHCQSLTPGELSIPSPFKPIRRLAPSIPVSFEALSTFPLTTRVSSQAAFVCRLPDSGLLHLTVFHRVVPRFVKLYPFEGSEAILKQVEQFLIEEMRFIAQNYARLKHIPFYQQSFSL